MEDFKISFFIYSRLEEYWKWFLLIQEFFSNYSVNDPLFITIQGHVKNCLDRNSQFLYLKYSVLNNCKSNPVCWKYFIWFNLWITDSFIQILFIKQLNPFIQIISLIVRNINSGAEDSLKPRNLTMSLTRQLTLYTNSIRLFPVLFQEEPKQFAMLIGSENS